MAEREFPGHRGHIILQSDLAYVPCVFWRENVRPERAAQRAGTHARRFGPRKVAAGY